MKYWKRKSTGTLLRNIEFETDIWRGNLLKMVMEYPGKSQYCKCPCGKSDGNDDVLIERTIGIADQTECEIISKKQCDICGKIYYVRTMYKFAYEQFAEPEEM